MGMSTASSRPVAQTSASLDVLSFLTPIGFDTPPLSREWSSPGPLNMRLLAVYTSPEWSGLVRGGSKYSSLDL